MKEKRQALISHAVTKGLDPNAPMKDSGIEWLGEIPAYWVLGPLKHSIDFIESGTSVNATDEPATENEIGVLKTSCVYTRRFVVTENKTVYPEEVKRVTCKLRPDTLIVSRMNTPDLVGAAGIVKVAPLNLYLPDRLWQISFKSVIPSFVYYWTQTHFYRSHVKNTCSGTSSSMQNLGQDEFKHFPFLNPSISEQQTIIDFLDIETARIDDMIGKIETQIEKIKEYRQALISAAVTGKIDVREYAQSVSQSQEPSLVLAGVGS